MAKSIISKYQDSIILTTIVDEEQTANVIAHHRDFLKLKYRVIEEDELPRNITLFFDAFRLKDGFDNITKPLFNYFYVDFEKAKEIWVSFYREVRQPLLESLDVEFTRALETSDAEKQKEVVQKKQALRDITNIENLPNDLDVIKTTWPSILGEIPSYLKGI